LEIKEFKKSYKEIDQALASVQDARQGNVALSDDWEYCQDRKRKYDVVEKILLFTKAEFRNVLEPACMEANAKAKTKEEKSKVINAKHEIKKEVLYIKALLCMVSEITDAFYLKYLDVDCPLFEELTRNCKMPEIIFDETPELSEVLKASDFESKCDRVEWLIEHFYDDVNAKLYLEKRLGAKKE
jgi:hypothetical protein